MRDRRFSRQSNSIPETKKTNKKTGVALSFFLLFIILGVISLILWQRQDNQQIQEIIIENTETVSGIDLANYSQEILENNYRFFIPRSNLFLFQDYWLANNIKADWPMINDLVIKKGETRNQKIIIIQERTPDTLWCKKDDYQNCFYVDQAGLIYDSAPIFSEGVFLKIFTHEQDYNIGQKIENFELILETKNLISELKNLGISVTNLKLLDSKRISLGIEKISNVKIPSTSMVIIKKDMTANQITERLKLVASAPDFRNKLLSNPEKLEYIDLRFENSIVYKFEESIESNANLISNE